MDAEEQKERCAAWGCSLGGSLGWALLGTFNVPYLLTVDGRLVNSECWVRKVKMDNKELRGQESWLSYDIFKLLNT